MPTTPAQSHVFDDDDMISIIFCRQLSWVGACAQLPRSPTCSTAVREEQCTNCWQQVIHHLGGWSFYVHLSELGMRFCRRVTRHLILQTGHLSVFSTLLPRHRRSVSRITLHIFHKRQKMFYRVISYQLLKPVLTPTRTHSHLHPSWRSATC